MQKGVEMSIIYKRPAVSFCIAMICGIISAFLLHSLIRTIITIIIVSACFFVAGKLYEKRRSVLAGILAFFIIGSLELLAFNYYRLNTFSDYKNTSITLRGTIVSEPEINGGKVTYIVNIIGIREKSGGDFIKKRGKILLNTLQNDGSGIFEYGREITFEGNISLPQGARNPGGFDYRRYLAQKGIGAVVFAYPYAIEAGENIKGNILVRAGLNIRRRIVTVIEKSLPRQQAGLLNGMLIGYREGLSEEVQRAFSDAGLTHIMAVSGANVAFLIMPLAFLFKSIHLRKKYANPIIIAFLIMFVFVTGFEPSVLRAVIMASILLISAVIYREPDTYSAIAVSCIILVAVNPYMLFNIGFQLSYAATLSIVMLSKNLKKMLTSARIPEIIADVLAVTLAAQIGVLPITLFYFNRLSLISIVPNILAGPVLELITVIGAMMALLGQISLILSKLLGYLNNIFLSFVLFITRISSDVSFAAITTVTPSPVFSAIYYTAVWFFLWYMPLKQIRLKQKHIAAGLSALAVLILVGSITPGKLEVTFIDVGQGDSAFIKTCTGRTVLIDGGGSTNPDIASNVGENTVIPFLLDKGVMRLDAVVASHPHSDHIQGLMAVLGRIKTGMLIIPSMDDESEFNQLLEIASVKKVPVFRCFAGQTIWLDSKTKLEVLNPEAGCSCENGSVNNASLVLRLVFGETEVLFTGDAEKEAEVRMIKELQNLSSDVIKIAHHGSSTSSDEAFIKKVNPKAAVISVGRNNFGHPSAETIALLEDCGIEYFRTDECGGILLKSDGRTIKFRKTIR